MYTPPERQLNCLLWQTLASLHILHILNKCQLLEVTVLQIAGKKKIPTRIHPGGHGISAMCPSRQRRAEPSIPEGLKYPWAPSPGEGPAACFASYKIANPMSYSVRSRPGPDWRVVSPAGREQHRAYTCSGHSTRPPEKANGFLAICLSLEILCSKYKLWD